MADKFAVDIITPVYGSPEFLELLAASLLEGEDAGVKFHWIIIDDATPEDRDRAGVLSLLRELDAYEHVTTIQNQVNGGFAKANNLAFSKGRAPLVLMLNSDTIAMEAGWMTHMVEHFEDPQVGAVGARLLFFEKHMVPNKGQSSRVAYTRPFGMIQHAGVGFNLFGQPYHMHLGWPPTHPRVMEQKELRCVTGACLMTRRDLWKRIGGLNEVYLTGNFEDVEYCVRISAPTYMSRTGYKVIYEPKTCLYHYAGGSGNSTTARRNEQIFRMRNGTLTTWDDWKFW